MIVTEISDYDKAAYFEWLKIHKENTLPIEHKTYLGWFLSEKGIDSRQKKLDEVYR